MSALDTSMTIANSRSELQKWTDPTAAKAGLFNATAAPNYIPRMNRVATRLCSKGQFKGLVQEIQFAGSTSGFITLTRRALAIMGGDIGNCPWPIWSTMNDYKELGFGFYDASSYTSQGFTDMGDGYCTKADIDPADPVYLKIVLDSASDAGKVIRFFGEDDGATNDDDPEPIYDAAGNLGLNVTTVNPNVQTTQVFTSLARITAPTMVGYWNLYGVSVNSGDATLLGRYEPGELSPTYRRYKCGVLNNITIRVFCKRRSVPMAAETDPVLPGCVDAFDYGLQALNLSDLKGPQSSEGYWALATKALNEEIEAARGRMNLTFPFRPPNPPSMPYTCR